MEKFSIGKQTAFNIIENAKQTVSAGFSIPEDSKWYTILPICLSQVCAMKKDLNDMKSLSQMSDGITLNMYSNPIGTLIYPTCILANFDFSKITPKDAKVISTMICKQPVDLNGKNYKSINSPVLLYRFSDILSVKNYIDNIKSIKDSANELAEIEVDNTPCVEFTAGMIEESKNNK